MKLRTWNQMQIDEANSAVNRYYFWQHYYREPKDFTELFIFYVESGGAKSFAEKHNRGEKDEK